MNSGSDRPLLLRSRLIAHGYRAEEVRRLYDRREVISVRPGAYVAAGDSRLREPAERHRLMVQAAVEQLSSGAVVSHASAAVLHGLALWSVPLDRVHVTRDRRSGGRRSRFLHLHVAALDTDEIVLVDGTAVTSVARTVSDLARTLPFEQGVVVADSALFRRLVRPEELAAAVSRSAHRHGTGVAGRVVAFADKGAESPGESRSRVALLRAGLPRPVLQQEMRSAAGVGLGRVDFWWPELETVGEFDGRVKYGRLVPDGLTPGDVVFAEKRREDAIREEGKRFVRWTWDELDPFDAVERRLRRAFGER